MIQDIGGGIWKMVGHGNLMKEVYLKFLNKKINFIERLEDLLLKKYMLMIYQL